MSDRLCVVIPVYNEQEVIGLVLEKWDAVLKSLDIDYEIRPYNDGSRDASLDVMKHVAQRLGVRVNVCDKPNGGHGNTILTGYREAASDGFDWIFQIDSDDEMGPEKFNELWSRRNGYDLLVGIRDGRKQVLSRKIISFISRLSVRTFYGKGVWDVNSPYRLMRVSAFKGFFSQIPLTTFAPNVILSGLAARNKLRCFEIRVPQHDRTTGEVSIKKWKLFKVAVKSFWQTISFSFSRTATSAKKNVVGCVLRLAVGFASLASVALVLLSISRMDYLACAALVIGFIFVIKRSSKICVAVENMASYIDRHVVLCLVVIFLAGLAMRTVLYLMQPDLSRFLKLGDCPVIWNQAKAMATGNFPEYKSWITPGVYAVTIKMFGESLLAAAVFNVACQMMTALAIYAFARITFQRASAGVAAVAGFFLSPFFAYFAFKIYTEHLHFLLVGTTFLLLRIWHINKSFWISLLIPLVSVVALYNRSDAGILLFALVPILYVCDTLLCRKDFRHAAIALGTFAAVGCCGLFIGWKINERYHGTNSVLCSHDGWWPRLFGANVATAGRCVFVQVDSKGKKILKSAGDKKVILERYREVTGLTPLMRRQTCPEELIPYIREEISRRWKAMSLLQIVKFVLLKERHVFAQVDRLDASCGARQEHAVVWAIASAVADLIRILCCVSVLIYIMRKIPRACNAKPNDEYTATVLFNLSPVLYCVGIVFMVAIAESNGRYGLIWTVFMSIYSFAIVNYWIQKGANQSSLIKIDEHGTGKSTERAE